jgi:DMSO/TMAO reductase YedYZ molybdopterin-dependent catalytic subunit
VSAPPDSSRPSPPAPNRRSRSQGPAGARKRRIRLPATPPPGPFRPAFWRSPLRGPWLTAALGSVLLTLVSIVIVTGFLSHVAYEPDLRGNAIVPVDLPLNFGWPTGPSWLYGVTQGLHVNVGLAAIPFLLAKLWSVIPRLFVWPPVASPAQAIERLSIALLVSSAVFQFATGVLNAQYWYAFEFNFVVAHYYGAIVFTAALVLHVLVKTPVIVRAYRDRGWLRPLRDDLARTRPEPPDADGAGDASSGRPGLAPVAPAEPTISRRGLFAFAGGASLLLVAANVGQTIGGPVRALAFLAPRREDFPVNKTAARAGVTRDMVGAAYRLTLAGGPSEVQFSRDDLLALPQHTATLPIACVEGWTTTQEWTGVRLSELARLAGVPAAGEAFVRSLQPAGVLSKASLSGDSVRHPDAMLALRVNGADLSLDHGFPARIIVPALPGVHNTKWVGSIEFS